MELRDRLNEIIAENAARWPERNKLDMFVRVHRRRKRAPDFFLRLTHACGALMGFQVNGAPHEAMVVECDGDGL